MMHPPAKTRLLAFIASASAREAVSRALAGLPEVGAEVFSADIAQVSPAMIREKAANVVLAEVDLARDEHFAHLKELVDSLGTDVGVIATAEHSTVDGVRRLMRLGIVDFVPQPATLEDLLVAIDHASRRRQPGPGAITDKARIISFVRPVGGAGASFLAVQLGCSLALWEKKRKQEPRVCLLDLDLQFGTAGLYLDLESQFSVIDILEFQDRFDGTYLRGLMAHHKSGLHLLAAPRDFIPLDALTPAVFKRIVVAAREEYDYVLIDLPHGWTDWMGTALALSDMVYFMMVLSVASISQGTRFLNFINNQAEVHSPVMLVLNRHGSRRGSDLRVREAEKALGRSFDYYVPNDYAIVSAASDAGVHTSDVKKNNEVGKSVDLIMTSMLNKFEPGSAEVDERPFFYRIKEALRD